MAGKKPQLEPRERQSYEEAGRAVIACQHQIGFERIALASEFNWEPVSVYRRLDEICPLTPGEPAELVTLDGYIKFLMAGTISHQLRGERYLGLVPKSTTQRRFRTRWYEAAWRNPERRLDLAYYYLAAWFPHWDTYTRDKERFQLWRKTCDYLDSPEVWKAVEQIAGWLGAGEVLSEADVIGALRPMT